MLNEYTKVLFQIVIRNFDLASDNPWLNSEEDVLFAELETRWIWCQLEHFMAVESVLV